MKRLVSLALACALALGICALCCAAGSTPKFSDVSADASYAEAVSYVAKQGLMEGIGNDAFDPDGALTRSMFATILYRMAKEPKVDGAPVFTDTKAGEWYSDAVVWAAKENYIQGYGNGLFGTTDPVSREMLQVILDRYMGRGDTWTGDPALAVSAKRWEIAVALYEELKALEPTPTPAPTRRPSSGGGSRPSVGGSVVTPTPSPTPSPSEAPGETDLGIAAPTPTQRQTIYLWADDNIPAWSGPRNSSEAEDYRPNMMFYPAQGEIKGAVLICPGGAFQFRSMSIEGYPIAQRLSELGYQSFIVNYRLRPYTQEEGALDLARGVRYVRYYAGEYGIDPSDIALVGFSAGGIQCGELLLHNDGTQLPTQLDQDYTPDALDSISADASAIGHIYSFYGRLSVSDNDVETLKRGDLPPTFYAYGTRDPFYSQFMQNANAVRAAGVRVEEHVFEGQPHGFGPGNSNSNWIPDFDRFLTDIFSNTEGEETVEPFTTATAVEDVMNDPAFEGFGRLLFPVDEGYWSGNTLGELRLTWYSHIDPNETVDIVNTLKNNALAGQSVFYDIYTDAEKAADPAKRDTGLFFFKGDEGAPFAICNAGGGWAYVGAMHDSFPHALELSKKGYNAFAIIYRPGAQTACEDLARAISFIFANADALGVSTDCYSLWGGSAGGRMTAYLSSYGPARFGGDDLPRPGASIIQYTGHSDYTGQEPPTYVCVGESDGIANWRTMEARQNALAALGIETEFHHYPGLGHGFGLGTGTVAEGWLDEAVAFWQKQIDKEAK